MTMLYDFDAPSVGSQQVTVYFFKDSVYVHSRNVNAVFDGQTYDPIATEDRVAEVANGVAVKIDAGVITLPESSEDTAARFAAAQARAEARAERQAP